MKKFFALFDNSRPTRDDNGVESVMYYFRINGMSAEEKAVYKADKGKYYVEDANGTPMYSVKNQNLGNELVIVRASKPNEKTGIYAWYHKRTEMQILDSLIEQYPSLSKSDAGFRRLETMAKEQFDGQFTTVTVADTTNVGEF